LHDTTVINHRSEAVPATKRTLHDLGAIIHRTD
jgi:hypothetical protein